MEIEKLLEIVRDAHEQAYQLGYEQGKSAKELEIQSEKVKRVVNEESRDRIVERAKADVEELIFERPLVKVNGLQGRSNTTIDSYGIEFVIDKKKRTIVALLRGLVSNKVRSRGIAKCAPSDCFNVHIGKAIALRRALGLEVPSEYLNAPQPTEVRVGDKVRLKNMRWFDSLNGKVETISGFNHDMKPLTKESAGYLNEGEFEIIDDSREEYEDKRKPRIGDLIEVRMPSGKTERLRIVDKDISEIGEDECSLYSAAVTRGRVVEEGEE